MMNTTLTTEQMELVKNWKEGFKACTCEEGIKYVYENGISAEDYCKFIGLDYNTVARLGEVGYTLVYNCVGDKYVLYCETFIDNYMDGRLSVESVETEDYLGFYGECMGDKKSDLLDMSADELKKYLEGNYDNYSELEELIKDDLDEEDIVDDWIERNAEDAFDKAISNISNYTLRDKIKDAIDEL